MDDSISRQAAIDVVRKCNVKEVTPSYMLIDKAEAMTELMMLPSAEPRPRGKWIDYTDDGYVECPFCGSATNCDDNISELHYCFSCGADMREEEQE